MKNGLLTLFIVAATISERYKFPMDRPELVRVATVDGHIVGLPASAPVPVFETKTAFDRYMVNLTSTEEGRKVINRFNNAMDSISRPNDTRTIRERAPEILAAAVEAVEWSKKNVKAPHAQIEAAIIGSNLGRDVYISSQIAPKSRLSRANPGDMLIRRKLPRDLISPMRSLRNSVRELVLSGLQPMTAAEVKDVIDQFKERDLRPPHRFVEQIKHHYAKLVS